MQSTTEQIRATLEEKQRARAELKASYKHEKAEVNKAIDSLQALKDQAETPEQFRNIAAQINDKREELEFLENKEATIGSAILTEEEYLSIKEQLTEANRKALDKSAPEIMQKYEAFIKAFNAYINEAEDLQNTLSTAQRLHYGREMGGHFAHSLKERTPDKLGYFNKVFFALFNHWRYIQVISRATKRPSMNADAARIYDAINGKY